MSISGPLLDQCDTDGLDYFRLGASFPLLGAATIALLSPPDFQSLWEALLCPVLVQMSSLEPQFLVLSLSSENSIPICNFQSYLSMLCGKKVVLFFVSFSQRKCMYKGVGPLLSVPEPDHRTHCVEIIPLFLFLQLLLCIVFQTPPKQKKIGVSTHLTHHPCPKVFLTLTRLPLNSPWTHLSISVALSHCILVTSQWTVPTPFWLPVP